MALTFSLITVLLPTELSGTTTRPTETPIHTREAEAQSAAGFTTLAESITPPQAGFLLGCT